MTTRKVENSEKHLLLEKPKGRLREEKGEVENFLEVNCTECFRLTLS